MAPAGGVVIPVRVHRLPHGRDLPLPAPASRGAAGLDLAAALPAPVTLNPGTWQGIPTGLVIALPAGYEAQVRPRSGWAARDGVTVLNAPGTIDADYRGEIIVLLINHGPRPVTIARGMRIAQMVVAPVASVAWDEVADLSATGATGRGDGGFGSTGRI